MNFVTVICLVKFMISKTEEKNLKGKKNLLNFHFNENTQTKNAFKAWKIKD